MTDSEGESWNSQILQRLVRHLRENGGKAPLSAIEAAGVPLNLLPDLIVQSNGILRQDSNTVQLFELASNASFYGESSKPKVKHRRPLAKQTKKKGIEGGKEGLGQVGYLCIAEEFQLDALLSHYRAQGYHCTLNFDVLHVTDRAPDDTVRETVPPQRGANYGSTAATSSTVGGFDVFVFQYGAVVYWGMNLRDYKRIVEEDFTMPKTKINKFMIERYTTKLIAENYPVWCTFEVDNSTQADADNERFREMLNWDHFLVKNNAADIKLCISHALAQSAKIDFLEIKVRDLTQQCKPLPRELKERGSVTISERRLLQLRGEVLFYRLMLKAGSDLIDEPELFWQNPWLKPLYQITKDFFEISERVETIDNKLQTNNDILGMIADQFNQRHGSRLEWIVIWLVMVEVVIGVLELILDVKPWMNSRAVPTVAQGVTGLLNH